MHSGKENNEKSTSGKIALGFACSIFSTIEN